MTNDATVAMDALRASDLLPLIIRRIEPFVTAFRELRRQWVGAGYTEPDDNGMLVGPDVTVGAYRRLCDLHRDLTGIVIDNAVTPRWKLVPMDLLTDLLSASRATSEDEGLSGVARVAEDLAVNALTFTAPPWAEVTSILATLATLQDPEREWASIGERLEESLSTGRAAAGLITRLAKAQVIAQANFAEQGAPTRLVIDRPLTEAERCQLLAAFSDPVSVTSLQVGPADTRTFQARVHPWMMACFGPAISADTIERNHRFLEEALELVQACGCTAADAHQLVDYVFGRPVGDRNQEVGGVMVTLAALCLAQGLDMHEAGETELARVWTKVEQIRAKQAAKPKGSPLPEPVAQQPQPAPAAAAALVAWLDEQDVILPDDPTYFVPVPASLLRRLRSADSGGGAQQSAQAQQPAGRAEVSVGDVVEIDGDAPWMADHEGVRYVVCGVQFKRDVLGRIDRNSRTAWLIEECDFGKTENGGFDDVDVDSLRVVRRAMLAASPPPPAAAPAQGWRPISEAKAGEGGLLLGNRNGVYPPGMPEKWAPGFVDDTGKTWDSEGYPLNATHFMRVNVPPLPAPPAPPAEGEG